MDLLIDAQQIDFLLTEIVPKATRINPKLLLNLIPFIEQNRLQTLTKDALQQAIDVLPLWAIRKWVYQLNRDKN